MYALLHTTERKNISKYFVEVRGLSNVVGVIDRTPLLSIIRYLNLVNDHVLVLNLT